LSSLRRICQALQEAARTFIFIHDSLKLYKALIFKQRKVKAIYQQTARL
jgi:hypothetical protein